MWQLLAKPLLGVVADGVKGFVETKKAKQELKLTTIKDNNLMQQIKEQLINQMLFGEEQLIQLTQLQ